MSLIGSNVNYKHYSSVSSGIIVDMFMGLKKVTNEGPWPSGGRGEYDSYIAVSYYIINSGGKFFKIDPLDIISYHIPESNLVNNGKE